MNVAISAMSSIRVNNSGEQTPRSRAAFSTNSTRPREFIRTPLDRSFGDDVVQGFIDLGPMGIFAIATLVLSFLPVSA